MVNDNQDDTIGLKVVEFNVWLKVILDPRLSCVKYVANIKEDEYLKLFF